jgi:hypothetical protein
VAFYLLLVVPHVVALGGLFAWAARVDPCGVGEDGVDGTDGGGGLEPPRKPRPLGPSGGLPLDSGEPPARRLRVGERLADLHPPPSRRDHNPAPAPRVPA